VLFFACQMTVNFPMLIVLGIVCGILDQFGDLSMSAIKRNFEVKDFGSWMPGHGGVLDRFDSLLYVGPCVCLFIMLQKYENPGKILVF
jgi:phosphatidate cytidylyltransferase